MKKRFTLSAVAVLFSLLWSGARADERLDSLSVVMEQFLSGLCEGFNENPAYLTTARESNTLKHMCSVIKSGNGDYIERLKQVKRSESYYAAKKRSLFNNLYYGALRAVGSKLEQKHVVYHGICLTVTPDTVKEDVYYIHQKSDLSKSLKHYRQSNPRAKNLEYFEICAGPVEGKEDQRIQLLDLSGLGLNNLPKLSSETASLLTDLSHLYLSENELTSMPENLESWNLNSLDEFDLSHNKINAFPDNWGTVFGEEVTLYKLNLSHNNMRGKIHPSLSKIQVPQLYLSHNKLSGSLPEGFENINPFVLDLSYNSFSGAFPEKILQLKNISTLNLSYNNFTGELPDLATEMSSMNSGAVNIAETNFKNVPENLSLIEF